MEENKSAEPLLDEVYMKIGFGKFHMITTIIFGFLQLFDAAELILLAFLGPILNCSWRNSMLESSFITISVFIGMILGSLTFGKVSDKFGRKKTILIGVCGISYFSVLCAFSPTVVWIVFSRGLIGYFIGNISIMISTYTTEIMPISHRGISQMSIQTFWSLGSYYISLLTIVLIPRYGWRMWLVISVCPMIFILPAVAWLPESPRYLLLVNRKAEALKVINYIASMNGAESVSNVNINKFKPSTSIKDILHPTYLLTTVICAYICFVAGTSYYGFVLSSSIINNVPHNCLQNLSLISDVSLYTNTLTDDSCCFVQTWDTMKTVFISITGELISFASSVFFIRLIRRKIYLQILMLVIGTVYFAMNFCLSPTYMGLLMMFGRGGAVTLIGVQYLYVSEAFPTTIRSLSIGIGSSFVRIGAISSPFIVNMIMAKISFLGSTLFYCGLNILGFILVFALPIETRNRSLMQRVEEEVIDEEILNVPDRNR